MTLISLILRVCSCLFGLLLLFASGLSAQPTESATSISTLVSPTERDFGTFGGAITTVDDLDGVAGPEILIGAHRENLPGSPERAGVVHAYDMSGNFVRSYESPMPQFNGFFGASLADVGDQNGDGRSDFLVGAYEEMGLGARNGVSYVISGLDGSAIYTLDSTNPRSQGTFGLVVASVPDVDGDAKADFLVGAGGEGNIPFSRSGRAYVFKSSDGTLAYPALQAQQLELNERFGARLAGLPDITGDGFGDLAIGAVPDGSGGSVGPGRVDLFDGASGTYLRSLFAAPTVPSPAVAFGSSITAVSDRDGDGRADLLIGARFETVESGGTNHDRSGRAYIFSSVTGAILDTFTAPEPAESDRFGSTAVSLGDTDGDGFDELAIGAPLDEHPASLRQETGLVYLFAGAPVRHVATLSSPSPGTLGLFGNTLAAPISSSGGTRDLLVGATNESPGGSQEGAGRVHLVRGLPTLFGTGFESGDFGDWSVTIP